MYGYDIVEKRLVVNEGEAYRAREAFRIYLETGSLIDTAQEMNARGWTTKGAMTKTGPRGAKPWNKGVLHGLLTNPTLVGRVVTDGKAYPGEHTAIIDEATWDAVQARLEKNGGPHVRGERHHSNALLAGILKCDLCGSSMTPTHCKKGPRRYFFYACSKRQKGGKAACPAPYVSAPKIEAEYVAKISAMATDPRVIAAVVEATREALAEKKRAVADEIRGLGRLIRNAERDRESLDDPAAVARLDARLAEYAARLGAVQGERAAVDGVTIDPDEIAGLLKDDFESVWGAMTSLERQKVVELLQPHV